MKLKIKEEFYLRNIKINDAKNYMKLISEKEISKEFGEFKTIKETEEFLRECINNPYIEKFLIIKKEKIIGEVSISDLNKFHKNAYLTYFISKKYSGKGITTTAVKIVIEEMIKKYQLVRIYTQLDFNNYASIRVLEKNNFKQEGILRKNKLRDKKFIDMILMAYVRED